MRNPKLFDTIELLIDMPEQNLTAGMRGSIVHKHTVDTYEIEFTNEKGETLALLALDTHQFIVVWRADTKQPVPIEDQLSQIIARIPKRSGEEILDFARFLSTRSKKRQPTGKIS